MERAVWTAAEELDILPGVPRRDMDGAGRDHEGRDDMIDREA